MKLRNKKTGRIVESIQPLIGKGGQAGHTGGFASMPRWKVVEAGRKGGQKSRKR